MPDNSVRVYYPEELTSQIFGLAKKYHFLANGGPICNKDVGHNQRFTFKNSDLANQFLNDVNGLVKAVEEKND